MRKILKPNNSKTQSIVFKANSNIFEKNDSKNLQYRISYYKKIVWYLERNPVIKDRNDRNLLFVLQGGYFIEIEPALFASCEAIHANIKHLGDVYYTTDIPKLQHEETIPLYKLSIDKLWRILDDCIKEY